MNVWLDDERAPHLYEPRMERNGVWPEEVFIHSMSSAGVARIAAVCERCGAEYDIQMARQGYGVRV